MSFGRQLIVIAFLLSTKLSAQEVLKRSAYARIPDSNTYTFSGNKGAVYFNPNTNEQSYYNIRLTSFDIGIDEKNWRNYEPVVVITITVGNKDLVRVLGSGNVELKDKRIRSRHNENLIGPFPFLGGEVKIELNVYRASVKDRFRETLDSITAITKAVGVDDVTKYTLIVEPVKSILDSWFAREKYNAISFAATWNTRLPNEPVTTPFREGYFIIYDEQVLIEPQKIKIDELARAVYDNAPISQAKINDNRFDYLILEFNHSLTKTNYQEHPFYKKYKEAKSAAESGNGDRMEKAFEEAKAILNVDLSFTDHDRRKLITKLYAQLVAEIKQHIPGYKEKPVPLSHYQAAAASLTDAVSLIEARDIALETGVLELGNGLETVEDVKAFAYKMGKPNLLLSPLRKEVVYSQIQDLIIDQGVLSDANRELRIPLESLSNQDIDSLKKNLESLRAEGVQ